MVNTIQGDTFNLMFTVSGEIDQIDRLIFSSADLGVVQDLEKQNAKQYLLEIDAAKTKNWKIGEATFDITVVFSNTHVRTIKYNEGIQVLKKTNRVN